MRLGTEGAGTGLLAQMRLTRLLPHANALSLPAKAAKSNVLNEGRNRGQPRLNAHPNGQGPTCSPVVRSAFPLPTPAC
jgi:hypothetical protein